MSTFAIRIEDNRRKAPFAVRTEPDYDLLPPERRAGRTMGEEDRTMLGSRSRVLIVDDDASMRHALFRMISRQPDLIAIGLASSGEEACASAELERPDVVVMDMQMPGMDGVEATRWITQHVPRSHVVGMSAADPSIAACSMRALPAPLRSSRSQMGCSAWSMPCTRQRPSPRLTKADARRRMR